VSFYAILMLAIGLAMDATVVAAARGLAVTRIGAQQVLLVAAFFGGFQALMPFIGWTVGVQIGPALAAWDHWIAFVLLGGLGVKMLVSAAHEGEGPAHTERERDPFALRVLLLLAIATSIDALAVGVTLPMLKAPLVLSLVTIGVTSAVFSGLGVVVGRRFGAAFGSRLDVVGGLVLIGLGTKILIEHLTAP
jgi:putative Mn2+ efflux pump MntP